LKDLKTVAGEESVSAKRRAETDLFITAAELRMEMNAEASNFHIPDEEFYQHIADGRSKLSSKFSKLGDDQVGQLYWQFTQFDRDGDGFITSKDFVKVIEYIDPQLSNKEDIEDRCQVL
jgi:hypothetical protein